MSIELNGKVYIITGGSRGFGLAMSKSLVERGAHMNVGMETQQVSHAVAFALSQPEGVAVDLLEIRPKRLMKKCSF
jgi:NADP-dependent 3-hydroxy acid dehydrogenase YdfG